MEIVVNLAPLYGHLTGIGYYTLGILRALTKRSEIRSIYGLTMSGVSKLESGIYLNHAPEKDDLIFNLRMVLGYLPYALGFIHFFQGLHLSRLDSKVIYWEPSYILIPYKGPKVVTIHDLSHLKCPRWHPPERRRWLRKNLEKSLKSADFVFVISESIKKEILESYSIDKPIEIIYPGIDDLFYRQSRKDVYTQRLKKFGLKWKRYLLYVGTLEPRKNLERLLFAFISLPRELRSRFPLIIVGAQGWASHSLKGKIERLARDGEVRWLGYISRYDLKALYAGAKIFVYPSLYEGFGMPVIEAMACGTPVLTSDRPALRESAGEAAYFIDPESIDSIREGLRTLLREESLVLKLKKTGLSWSSQFRWDSSAIKFISCLKKIANQL